MTAQEFATFRICNPMFGVSVLGIHDVFRPAAMTAVPHSGPEIAGVLNLRGRIVTAIDAGSRLGYHSQQNQELARIWPSASRAKAIASGCKSTRSERWSGCKKVNWSKTPLTLTRHGRAYSAAFTALKTASWSKWTLTGCWLAQAPRMLLPQPDRGYWRRRA